MTMREASKPAAKPMRPLVRRVDVQEILGGAREVILLHAQEEYRLRLTSNGKLILTK